MQGFIRMAVDPANVKDKKVAKLVRRLQRRVQELVKEEIGLDATVAVKIYALPPGMTVERALLSEAVHMMKAEEEKERTAAAVH